MEHKGKRGIPKPRSRVEECAVVYGAARPEATAGDLEAGEVLERIRDGLPMAEFEALRNLLGLNAEQLAEHLSISRSTLVRRRKAGRLDTLESDRLLRLARLYGRALEVMGSAEVACEWLSTPARALEHSTPLQFAETEAGGREVEALLGRIEYGVFS